MEVFFDIEAASLAFWDKVWCLSYNLDGRKGTVYGREDAVSLMAEWYATPGLTIVGHNIVAYDLPCLFWGREFPQLKAKVTDTLLLSKIMYPFNRIHGLAWHGEQLAKEGLCPPKVEIAEDMWEQGNLPLMKQRCEVDVEITKALYKKLSHSRNAKWLRLEQDWSAYMAQAQSLGVPYKMGQGLEVAALMDERITNRMRKSKWYEKGIHLGSVKDWQTYLKGKYDFDLPLKPPTKSALKKAAKEGVEPKQNPTMCKDNKAQLVAQVPEIQLHYEHKEDVHTRGFFSLNMIEIETKNNNVWSKCKINPITGTAHIYGGYSYYGTRTLRSAYRSPCFNSFPKGRVRQCVGFKPNSKWKLLGLDIDQLELAWLGYLLRKLCGDTRVWEEKEAGLSPKKLTLTAYAGLFENVPKLERDDRAKTVNYATIYGQRSMGTAITLGLSPSNQNIEAIDRAREKRFPSLDRLTQRLDDKVSGRGLMLNAYGQPVKATKGVGADMRATALNTMMQSSGNAYAKRVFWHIMEELSKQVRGASLCLQNHDEIQVVVPRETTTACVEGVLEQARHTFEQEKFGGIPCITWVSTQMGDTWDETH